MHTGVLNEITIQMLEQTTDKKDFLIIGSGIAACTLAHTFEKYGLTFHIISQPNLSNCSKIAAGLWNPIVFKRLTKSWLANELIDYLIPFYKEIEHKTATEFITERPIIKNFFEQQEINFWSKKANADLKDFLQQPVLNAQELNFKGAMVTQQVGVIKRAGNIYTNKFIETTLKYFKDSLSIELFNYQDLSTDNNIAYYRGLNFKNVIFCEGHLVSQNPFFNFIRLKPAKGELFKISAENLNLNNAVLNKDGFIFNNALNEFTVGSTYEWLNLDENPTITAKTELQNKLSQLITVPYNIHSHEAGIRPSSADRRPIIGKHPQFSNLFIFNGLGTKGVMLAPYFANNFVNFYLHKEMLHNEVNVTRFYSNYHA